MSTKSRRFVKGITTKPTTSPATEEGEIRNDSVDNKQKVYTEGSERSIVTEDQSQTLSNKTINSANNTVTVDADTATVSNLETDNLKAGVLETDLNNAVTDTNLASAAAIKTYVAQEIATKDEASEISYDDTGNDKVVGANVQAALDSAETAIDANETAASTAQSTADNHIADVADAHTASAITNIPSGNLVATDVQSALNEIQTELDGKAVSSEITDHINDATDAHAGTAITHNPAGNSLTATTMQAAADEIAGRLDSTETATTTAQSTIDSHIANASGAHAASAISNTPSGNLAATDVQAALDELQTDVDTRATSVDLVAHTGASSGVHGVTGDVVGTTDTQTLTNKTITGADFRTPARSDVKQDTRANLEVYATTASDGQVVFATDEQIYLGVVDNELVELGGGLGSAQTIFVIEADKENTASDFDGNDSVFGGNNASSVNGSLSLSTTSSEFLTGVKKVFKYGSGIGAQFDYYGWTRSIPQGWAGRTVALEFTYRNNSSTNNGDYAINVKDETNGNILLTKTLNAASSTDGNGDTLRYLLQIPTDCTSISVGPQNVGSNNSSDIFIDKISMDIDDFNYKNVQNITDWEPYSPTYTGFGTVAAEDMYYRIVGDTLQIKGSFTAGTTTATTAKMSLPTGYTIDTTKIASAAIESVGVWFRGATAAAAGGSVNIISTDTDEIFFSENAVFSNSSANALGQANANSVISTGERIGFPLITIPIVEGSAFSKHVVVDSGEADTEVYRIDTHGGLSSTNTRVPYFANIREDETGNLITVSNSSTTGFRVTAIEDVEITMSYQCMYSGTGGAFGITKGSTELSTGIDSISDRSKVVARANTISTNTSSNAVYTGVLKAGEYIVPHVNATSFNTSVASQTVTVRATKATKGEYFLVPVTEQENVFSARIANNGTATITSESSSFIDTVTRTVAGRVVITFKSGIFTTEPAITAIPDGPTGNKFAAINNVSVTGFTVDIDADNSTGTDHDFHIHVHKQGVDYKEPKAFIGEANLVKTVVLREEQPSGTNGGTFTSGAWQTRTLNTVDGDSTVATLSSNQFTLRPGTYDIDFGAIGAKVNVHQTKIRNVTDSTDVGLGIQAWATTSQNIGVISSGNATITITSTKTFELQHRCQTTAATNGFGPAHSFGTEVYSTVKITRLR